MIKIVENKFETKREIIKLFFLQNKKKCLQRKKSSIHKIGTKIVEISLSNKRNDKYLQNGNRNCPDCKRKQNLNS